MTDYVILSGANGYLGSYIVRELALRGLGVIACRFPHHASTIIKHQLVEYVDADISIMATEQELLAQAIKNKNIIAIINAAALLGSPDYNANYRVNTYGVANMIDFARLHGIKRFIQISSVVVLKEFKGPYGITKLKGQELLVESELDYTVFIPAMIMGPESLGLNRVLKNVFRLPLIVPLIGNGKQTQHPIFVKDFTSAIVDAINAQSTIRKVYEIAGDNIIPFRDFIRAILKHYKKKKLFMYIPSFVAFVLGRFFQKTQKVPLFTAEHVKGILQDSILDTSRLRSDLDFRPTPFAEALRQSLDVIGENWDYYLKPRTEINLIFDPDKNEFISKY